MKHYSRDLLVEYLNFSRRSALQFGATYADASDLAQVAVLAYMTTESQIENPEAWLVTVVKRRHLDIVRARQKEKISDPHVLDIESGPSFEEDVIRQLAAKTRFEYLLDQAEQVLSPKELQAFNDLATIPSSAYTLSEFAALIAQRRNENPETTRTHLRRTAAKLKKLESTVGDPNAG